MWDDAFGRFEPGDQALAHQGRRDPRDGAHPRDLRQPLAEQRDAVAPRRPSIRPHPPEPAITGRAPNAA